MHSDVFLDTCVLFPPTLRDTLLRLAELEIYRPLWSADVLIELRRTLVRNRVNETQHLGLFEAMRTNFAEAEVEGYEHLISAMTCHPKDRHVVAAALHARAPVILTFNTRDFPAESLDPYGIIAEHPSSFLLAALQRDRDLVLDTLARQARTNRFHPTTLDQLLHVLERTGVPAFTAEVRRLIG